VVKTSPEIFRRIVREGYVPDVAEFMSGTIKTNDPSLMLEFAKVFQLGSGA
jgi:long-chain acyl-CoA synthetase